MHNPVILDTPRFIRSSSVVMQNNKSASPNSETRLKAGLTMTSPQACFQGDAPNQTADLHQYGLVLPFLLPSSQSATGNSHTAMPPAASSCELVRIRVSHGFSTDFTLHNQLISRFCTSFHFNKKYSQPQYRLPTPVKSLPFRSELLYLENKKNRPSL